MINTTSNRAKPPRYAKLDGKPPRKPRGRHTGTPGVYREVINIPVSQRLAFRPAEFAALVGLSYTTIWRGIKSGKIETVVQNGVKVIPRSYAIKAGYITDTI